MHPPQREPRLVHVWAPLFRGRHRARPVVAVLATALALAATALALTAATSPAAHAQTAAGLPACPFWSTVTPPVRSDTPFVPPEQTAPPFDLSGRPPAPANITGTLASGAVTLTFDRVPGAQAYRVWRNGQAVAWVSDFGQPTLTATDTAPCQHAFYSVVALFDQSGSDASMGQLSAPYQLDADGVVVPWQVPVGQTIDMLVTSYNDGGQTASGYTAGLGKCAVDPRIIPWGTYFTVPGYGTCYAADIGLWIQNDTVDLWLPGLQANNWGVQHRTITIVANPNGGAPPSSPPTSPPPPTTSPTTPPPSSPPPSQPPAGVNLVANGDFESGALGPWTCDAGTASVVGTPVHGGTHAAALAATASDDAQCTQTVPVSPNTTYTLSGWARGEYAFLGVTGGAEASTFTPSATDYAPLTTSFTTGASTTSVTVFAHGWFGHGTVDVDDITLTG